MPTQNNLAKSTSTLPKTVPMERLLIDLSGQEGLVSRFYGDYPFNVTHPELALFGGTSQYASGVVNPIAKNGYISPANYTSEVVYSGLAGLPCATEVDDTQSDPFVFLYATDSTIQRTIGLNNISTFGDSHQANADGLGYDLAWYTVDGVRKLFFSYGNSSTGIEDIGVWDLLGVSSVGSPAVGTNGSNQFLGYENNSVTITLCTITMGSAVVACPSGTNTSELNPGSDITGSGIPAHTYIISISGLNITMSAEATSGGTNPITIYNIFKLGETITGSTSGVTGVISGNWYNNGSASGSGVLFLENISVPSTGFTSGETITGSTTGYTANAVTSGSGGFSGSIVNNLFSTYMGIGPTGVNAVGTGAVNSVLVQGVSTTGVPAYLSNGHLNPDSDYINTPGLSMTTGNYVKLIPTFLDGFMYILQGSSIHLYDGTFPTGQDAINVDASTPLFPAVGNNAGFGVVYPNLFEVPESYQFIDGLELQGSLWVVMLGTPRNIWYGTTTAALYEDNCGVLLITEPSTTNSTQNHIPVTGVREIRSIHAFQDIPYIFDISSSRYTELRAWNGTGFKVVVELGQEAYPRFHDSVSINGSMMRWIGNDGQFYAYGKITPQQKSNALYQFGDSTSWVSNSHTFTNAGALIMADGSQSPNTGYNTTPEAFYLGLTDSSSESRILKWYPNAYEGDGELFDAHVGNYYSLVTALPKLSQTHYLTLYYPPVGSGGSNTLMNINLYFNQSTTPWNGSAIPITQADAQRGYKTIPFHQHGVNFVQVGWTYASTTDISTIPTPSFATLDYTPTTQIM